MPGWRRVEVMGTLEVIREFLVHLPGEVERHVDLLKMAAVIADAEDLARPGDNRYVAGMRPWVAERQKQREEIGKGSLTEQIAASLVNQERMRESLHTLNNQLKLKGLEVQSLSNDLHRAHQDTIALSAQLTSANRRIVELTS